MIPKSAQNDKATENQAALQEKTIFKSENDTERTTMIIVEKMTLGWCLTWMTRTGRGHHMGMRRCGGSDGHGQDPVRLLGDVGAGVGNGDVEHRCFERRWNLKNNVYLALYIHSVSRLKQNTSG